MFSEMVVIVLTYTINVAGMGQRLIEFFHLQNSQKNKKFHEKILYN